LAVEFDVCVEFETDEGTMSWVVVIIVVLVPVLSCLSGPKVTNVDTEVDVIMVCEGVGVGAGVEVLLED